MNSMREIKQRISNISSVEQIIKAMDMVASAKLIKARAQLEGVRPIYNNLKRIVEELANNPDAKENIFFKKREVKSTLYIVITSDRGLSGSYNANILKKALRHMNQGKNEKIYVVGAKGQEFFREHGKNIIRTVTDVADAQVYYGSEKLANRLIDYYLSGEIEEVFVAYTHFESVLSYIPVVEKILPVEAQELKGNDLDERRYEPNAEVFIEHTVPLFVHMNLFRAFSESHTSEQAARMVNMDAAGKNAEEILEDLKRLYNRKRQTTITQEISEIVGSTGILNKGD